MQEGLPQRIQRLVEAAGSQRALARIVGVRDGTVIGWLGGSVPQGSTLYDIIDRTGVSREWLIDGRGDDEHELTKFRARLEQRSAEHGTSGPRGELQTVLARAGISPAQLAKRIRYDPGVIDAVVNGTARISEPMAEKIVSVLPELSVERLLAGSDSANVLREDGAEATFGAKPRLALPPGVKGRYVPLLSLAEAGPWDAGHDDAFYDYTAVFAPNVDDRRAFAIRVSGNSMERALFDGDTVICSPSASLVQGEAAVVRTKSEQVFIKLWGRSGDSVILESVNPAYKPIIFPASEIAGAWHIVWSGGNRKITKQLPT